MRTRFRPTNEEIEAAFVQEIGPYVGTVWDRYDDGDRLYLRSVYPQVSAVLPGDHFQRGVALRSVDEEIVIYPYLFRQVCRNGAILAWAVGSHTLQRVKSRSPAHRVAEVVDELCAVIHGCSDELVLHNAVEQIRSATETEANVVLQLMPLLSRMPQGQVADLLDRITTRFESQRSRTLFGLMNAVTSVARDTRDPEMRWRLEELGGGLPVGLVPSGRPFDSAARSLVTA